MLIPVEKNFTSQKAKILYGCFALEKTKAFFKFAFSFIIIWFYKTIQLLNF